MRVKQIFHQAVHDGSILIRPRKPQDGLIPKFSRGSKLKSINQPIPSYISTNSWLQSIASNVLSLPLRDTCYRAHRSTPTAIPTSNIRCPHRLPHPIPLSTPIRLQVSTTIGAHICWIWWVGIGDRVLGRRPAGSPILSGRLSCRSGGSC